jgi:Polysaccharide biosynthesis enzyme WcbI
MSAHRSTDERAVIVWGNCQAEPIAELLAAPLRDQGLQVVPVPPVYLIDEAGLERVRRLVSGAAVFITQPVRDEYRLAGCGSDQLAALLPTGGRVLRFPVAFHLGPFPFQTNASGADGARVLAPLTDYHDLRTVVAAERGLTVEQTLAWYPVPSSETVRAVAQRSRGELARREAGLDIAVSDLLDEPDAMFTISHPSNALLATVADRMLRALGLEGSVAVPEREFLGARRAPVELAVAQALGWPARSDRPDWIVEHREIPLATVVQAHLQFYRSRPDVVADTRIRQQARLVELGL